MGHVSPQQIEQKFLQDFETLSDEFFRFALYQVSDREVAVDLVQEVWIETWNYISKGEGIQNLRAFVYTVLRRRIIDWRRKRKSDSLDSLSENGFDPRAAESAIADSAARDTARILHQALAELSDNDRELITLRFLQSVPIAQMAEILGLPAPNISVQLHRAKEKLQSELRKQGFDGSYFDTYEQ